MAAGFLEPQFTTSFPPASSCLSNKLDANNIPTSDVCCTGGLILKNGKCDCVGSRELQSNNSCGACVYAGDECGSHDYWSSTDCICKPCSGNKVQNPDNPSSCKCANSTELEATCIANNQVYDGYWCSCRTCSDRGPNVIYDPDRRSCTCAPTAPSSETCNSEGQVYDSYRCRCGSACPEGTRADGASCVGCSMTCPGTTIVDSLCSACVCPYPLTRVGDECVRVTTE